ncbi:peptidoglycan-binding domain-containing protein [Streptomyces sp. NPDC048417]|uniref:peptidoglycan-binding domain-containing protein n=1 Tax=Streptomyces sp. NPDC048417 TaxID=3155387 RepID=UPI0034224A8D
MNHRKGLVLLAAVACSLAVSTTSASAAATSADPKVTASVVHPASRCLVWTKETTNYIGLTAGYSWAWNVTVQPGATGDRVKEIQCLTDYYGEGPSALDGIYGPATTAAVKRVQARCGFSSAEQDGIVGPMTWRCLRIP